MSTTSMIMMACTLGFYGIGFIYLLNKAYKSGREDEK